MIKLMIATPAMGGNVNINYALSFAATVNYLNANNVSVQPLIISSGSLLVAERNRIIETFWQSDCTHILCIDADLGWNPEVVGELFMYQKEFIGGVYPARGMQNAFIFRAKHNPNGSVVQHGPLIQMEYIPAGFMLIARTAVEKMRNKFPELYYEPKDERNKSEKAFCFFNTEVWKGEFWGEDYVFCRKAREAGVEIWVDPRIEFDHAGTKGVLLNCLIAKDENGKDIPLGENK